MAGEDDGKHDVTRHGAAARDARADGQDIARQPARKPAGIQVQVRIEASGLPGRDWDPGGQGAPQRNIYVGVQSRATPVGLLGLHPGDAPSALWEFHATAHPTGGGTDVRGPYIQGRPGGRFIYLAWGSVDDAGAFSMFMRAKLMLDAVDPATLEAACRHGHLTARLRLTDPRGRPLHAAVRPPLVGWSVDPPNQA